MARYSLLATCISLSTLSASLAFAGLFPVALGQTAYPTPEARQTNTPYSQIPDEDICATLIHSAEQKRLIPHQLLLAVAHVESTNVQTQAPWPWTINVRGEGKFFESAYEAIQTVNHLVSSGETNIDIGCMQINYRYHGQAFDSIASMFDPLHNVAYATTFLLSLYERYGLWSEAIRHYHSATPQKHTLYHKNVMETWDQLAPPQAPNEAPPAPQKQLSENERLILNLIRDTEQRYNIRIDPIKQNQLTIGHGNR